MKKRCFLIFLGSFLVLVWCVVLVSCSRAREIQPATSPESPENSLYPHRAEWGAQHMTFMAKHATPSGACLVCHAESTVRSKAEALKISCGSGCHPEKRGRSAGFHAKKNYTVPKCVECHDGKFGPKMPHAPGAVGQCEVCHEVKTAHFEAGDTQYVKTQKTNASCTRCHERVDPSGMAIHPVVKDENGGCTNCHDPHSSDFFLLLKANYPGGDSAVYKAGETYALCFQCHDEGMLKEAITGPETNFRDGTKNLHYLHVAKIGNGGAPRPGRTCRMCHDPHSAAQAHLIHAKMPTGGRPFGYAASETGGTCAKVCHGPKTYQR